MNNCSTNIELYFIRHGFSCANYYKRVSKAEKNMFSLNKLYALIKDPVVTESGLKALRSINVQNIIGDKPLFILSSPLIRAIQTATTLFPNDKIYVAPYIGEKAGSNFSIGRDNTPDPPGIQLQKLKKKNIIYSYIDGTPQDTIDQLNQKFKNKGGEKLTQPDFNKFIAWLHNFLLQNNIHNHNTVKIVVVSHSNFMRKILVDPNNTDKDDKPRNGAIIMMKLCMTQDKIFQRTDICQKIPTFKNVLRSQKSPCYTINYNGVPDPDITLPKGFLNCNIKKSLSPWLSPVSTYNSSIELMPVGHVLTGKKSSSRIEPKLLSRKPSIERSQNWCSLIKEYNANPTMETKKKIEGIIQQNTLTINDFKECIEKRHFQNVFRVPLMMATVKFLSKVKNKRKVKSKPRKVKSK